MMENRNNYKRKKMEMKMEKKNILILIMFTLSIILFSTNVKADSYQLYCLDRGEVLDLPRLCNPAMEPRSGPINICMHILDNGKICPASINSCNNLGLGCSDNGSNTTIDITPPILFISSPILGEVYSERSVLFDVNPNEKSTMAYIDNSEEGSGWKQICSKCTLYSQKRTFKEGFNNITLRAVDTSGNTAYYDLYFYVDSSKPKMGNSLPKSGFASGVFNIEFTEANPMSLKLKYGNVDTAFREYNVNIENECVINAGKYICEIVINLLDYDEETIEYYFEILDIASNSAVSKTIVLLVDYSSPKINSLNYIIEGKYVILNLDITEQNIDKIVYIENNDPKAKEKTLCSGMSSNLCIKKISFKDGNHNVSIIIRDKAGNFVTYNLLFFTDSKTPKIKKTEPKKGFASGSFYVEFQEENPQLLKLFIENSGTVEHNIDLNSCNYLGEGNKYSCNVDLDLEIYNQEQIKYWFMLTDRVNNSISSKPIFLMVDTSSPIISNISFIIKKMTAVVTLDISEDNLDEVTYSNNDDLVPKEKSFCTTLKDGKCTKKIILNSGDNEITFYVYDEAGNMLAQNIFINT